MATATFEYKVRDSAGQVKTGTLEAETPSQVATKLKTMGYAPLSITPYPSRPIRTARHQPSRPLRAPPRRAGGLVQRLLRLEETSAEQAREGERATRRRDRGHP